MGESAERWEGVGIDTVTRAPSSEPGFCPAMSQVPTNSTSFDSCEMSGIALWNLRKPQAEHRGRTRLPVGTAWRSGYRECSPTHPRACPPGTAMGCTGASSGFQSILSGERSPLHRCPRIQPPWPHAFSIPSPDPGPRAGLCPAPCTVAWGLPSQAQECAGGSPHVSCYQTAAHKACSRL